MTARAALASLFSHLLLVAAVGFALYPVLWVVALAFSGAAEPAARAIPLPVDPTLDHLQQVELRGHLEQRPDVLGLLVKLRDVRDHLPRAEAAAGEGAHGVARGDAWPPTDAPHEPRDGQRHRHPDRRHQVVHRRRDALLPKTSSGCSSPLHCFE